MSEQLKPCPFCGSEAEMVSSQVAEDTTETWAYCKSCGARTEGFEAAYSEHEGVASDWNNRPTEKAAREEVLELACKYINGELDVNHESEFRQAYKDQFNEQG